MVETNAQKHRRNSVRRSNYWSESLSRFLKDKIAVISLILLIVITVVVVFAPKFTPYGYRDVYLDNRYAPMSPEHPFGTDGYGRDMWARILYGGQVTLNVTYTAVIIAAIIGSLLGITAGVVSAPADSLILRLMDGLSAIPTLLLAVLIEFFMGFGKGYYKYAIALSLIPPSVRLLRPLVITVMKSEYVEAARALGVKLPEVIVRHVIPNIAAPAIIHFSNLAAEALLTSTVMGYLGVGVFPPRPEWGEMVAFGYNYIRSRPTISLIPCFVVAVTALAFSMVGNGIRDALDPEEL